MKMPISGCCRKQHPLVLCVGRSWGSCCSRGGEYLPPFAPRVVILLLRKETRGGGEAATRYSFVPFRHDQRTEPVWRLCDRPLETFARPLPVIVRSPTLVGRGGSVSRRDHNQAAWNRAHLAGGTKPKETYPAERQPLFGREREGGASLREAASLATLTFDFSSLRIAAGRLVL